MSSIFYHPMANHFGLYQFGCMHCSKHPDVTNQAQRKITRNNIIGWFPVIGNVMGIYKLIQGIRSYRTESAQQFQNLDKIADAKGLILRGATEAISLGPLLFFIDLIFTIGRSILEHQKTLRVEHS